MSDDAEVGGARSVGVHHEDRVVAGSVAVKGNVPTVWRPRRDILRRWGRRETGLPGSIRIHDVDLVVAVARADERQPATVGRPGRIGVRRSRGEPGLSRTVWIHHVDFGIPV